MVRLLPLRSQGEVGEKEVSIPQWCDCCFSMCEHGHRLRQRFQSHNGAIAAILEADNLLRLLNVSIPQWCDCCDQLFDDLRLGDEVFQSHNGAIAATKLTSAVIGLASFNPTMVRLLRELAFQSSVDDLGFNPTMVRLLRRGINEPEPTPVSFNPTMVRLLQEVIWMEQTSLTEVSIPQWCDCCNGAG